MHRPEEGIRFFGARVKGNWPTWVMEIALGSCGRAVSTFNQCTISPATLIREKRTEDGEERVSKREMNMRERDK